MACSGCVDGVGIRAKLDCDRKSGQNVAREQKLRVEKCVELAADGLLAALVVGRGKHGAVGLGAGNKTQKLTTKESELLSLLCQHMNDILERNYALKSIWIDDNYFNARSMDVYITKLRKLLRDDPSIEIINIHGKGYKLIAPEVPQNEEA